MPENEIKLDDKIHDAWHVLFGNLFTEEVIGLIQYVWQDNYGQIREKYLIGEMKRLKRGKKKDKRFSAWQTIFGDTRLAKNAIKIIKETFTKRV